MTTWSNKSPQPCDCRRKELNNAENALTRNILCRWRGSSTKATNIDCSGNNGTLGYEVTRHNNTWVRAWLTVTINDMISDTADFAFLSNNVNETDVLSWIAT